MGPVQQAARNFRWIQAAAATLTVVAVAVVAVLADGLEAPLTIVLSGAVALTLLEVLIRRVEGISKGKARLWIWTIIGLGAVGAWALGRFVG